MAGPGGTKVGGPGSPGAAGGGNPLPKSI